MRKFGQYLLANPMHAMVFAMLCALLPLIPLPGGFLAAAVLVGFVTLCRGYKAGLLVLLGAGLPVLAIAIWKQAFLFDFIWVRCALVWILASILGATVSWRLVLEIMTVLGILTVLAFHWVLGDASSWIIGRYQFLLNSVLAGQVSAERIQEVIAQVTPIATGLFTALMLLGAFCQLLVARWWQAHIWRPGGLAKEFVEVRAGLILAVILTITVIAALLGMAFAIDLLPVVILPLAICGLSLLHKWARSNKKIVYLLAAVYIGLVFLPVALIVILALAGYTDSWYDLRKRYLIPKKGV